MQTRRRDAFDALCRIAPSRTALALGLALLALAAVPAHAQVVTEFSTTAGATPQGIAAGPDGNVWFTERFGDRIGQITPTGTITEFSTGIHGDAQPASIALGSDGNLWFTEGATNRIGMITTAGAITEFNIPPPYGGPYGIAAGSDGNLWFTVAPNAIGRIDPITHVFAMFNTGISDTYPYSIAAGPDNNLWFTEPSSGKIGQITPAGVVTEFVATGFATGNSLGVITAGPDGNLWFTSSFDKAIGVMTTAGAVVNKFTAGISSSALIVGIAQGPDGNLWFTEGNSIGRITTAGVVTEYTTGISPGGATPFITAGPDGNLWFSEDAIDKIGRITIPLASPPVLVSAASRRTHVDSGRFDLPLTITTPPTINRNPTTEPRVGPAQLIVFTFDKPISSAAAAVTEGIATVGVSTINGNDVVVGLTGVTDAQYVTVALSNVASTDGGTGGSASARAGFLVGDVNQSRLVAVTDLVVVNNQLGKPLTAANFLSDVNVSGIITVLDKVFVNNALGHFLPAP